jgi:hypothetical protein
MSELERELFEKRLTLISMGLEYPRTPDIAGSVMTRLRHSTGSRFISRKLAWSLTIMLILVSSLVLIPPVRAAIIEFIQIGVVRIFPRSVEPTPEVIRTAIPETMSPLTATPGVSIPPPSLIPQFENIAGETKLANAQQIANYPILLPTYPPELGQPNHVYIQDADGAMTILVWVDPVHPEDAMMSLHFIPEGSWAISKVRPVVIQETEVNGQRAIWAVGPYPLKLRNGNLEFTRLIDGHVLVWAEGNITYRIETDLPLEEAIKIAESLQPIP